MGAMSVWHWLIVAVVVVLVFGTGKLRNIGSDIGAGLGGIRKGLKEATDDSDGVSLTEVAHDLKDGAGKVKEVFKK